MRELHTISALQQNISALLKNTEGKDSGYIRGYKDGITCALLALDETMQGLEAEIEEHYAAMMANNMEKTDWGDPF